MQIRGVARKKILLLLCAGVSLALSKSPRKHIHILKQIPREWKRINRRALQEAIKDFYINKLVEFKDKEDGTVQVVLTEEGKRKTIRFNIDEMKLEKPAQWDKKWRIVLFDVPEKKRRARDILRDKLRELDFYEWQKSVFISPYPCLDEVEFIAEYFDIRPYIRYAEAFTVMNEAEIKHAFRIY